MLTSLRELIIRFPYPDHETRHLSPQKRSVLPALTFFEFGGAGKYLGDLVAHIDAPRLDYLEITIKVHFATPLLQLVGRTPSLKTPDNARFVFSPSAVRITLLSQTGKLSVKMYNGYPFRMTYLRVLTLARVFASPFHSEEPRLLRAWRFTITTPVGRRHRDHAVVGTFTSIYCCEEPLPIRGMWTTYRTRPARTR